jgi:tetratricopeptide (TPR) repeat protein
MEANLAVRLPWPRLDGTLLLARALIALAQVLMPLVEWITPEPKRSKLREHRVRLNEIVRDSRDLDRELARESTSSTASWEKMEAFMARHGDPDDERWRAHREKMRAIQTEGDQLRRVREEAAADPEAAVAAFAAYLEHHPESSLGRHALAGALNGAARFEESLALYQGLLEQEVAEGRPGHLTRLTMAQLRMKRGDLADAERELRELATTKEPGREFVQAGAFLYLGDVLQKRGEPHAAREAWKKAIRHDRLRVVAAEARQRLRAASD